MYKIIIVFILVAISSVLCETRLSTGHSKKIQQFQQLWQPKDKGLDWCPQCINTFDDLIELVLDAILQYGILNSCGDLCDIVIDKSGSTLLGFMCMVGCDILGIEEFSKLIQKADIDPIYYCEQIKLCPINDNGDAHFKSFAILPPRAPIGSTISIDFVFVSNNGTGTGEIVLTVDTVDKVPLSGTFLLESQKAGTYGQRVTIDASPDPDCDPTQDQCEEWLPGRYNVTILICNGQCGSHHPHTQLYDIARGYFDLYE